jgi:hypothetical protein
LLPSQTLMTGIGPERHSSLRPFSFLAAGFLSVYSFSLLAAPSS